MKTWARWHSRFTTQTEEFTAALASVKRGDKIVFRKNLPCYIWDDRFIVENATGQEFSGRVKNTTELKEVILKFDRQGRPSIEGIEIMKIVSGGKSITKYPSNALYEAAEWMIIMAIIGALLLFLFLAERFLS